MAGRVYRNGYVSIYWSDMRVSGGMPVAYTGIDGSIYRSLQTGIWGIQIGKVFVGVIRGHRDPGYEYRKPR